MEIADVPAALKKVQSFIVVLKRGKQEWSKDGTSPSISDYRTNDILERLPLIVRIAARVDAELPAKLQEESDGWPYDQTLKAAQQLAGLLKATEDAQQILGPVGPKLAAANLHRWIWNAAVGLWDDGHPREAVQAAAVALFDHQLLAALQSQQAKHRNQQGGYWIAEADPDAAKYARLSRYPITSVPWAVLTTDGAYKTMIHLGITDWPALRNASSSDLAQLLKRCQSWETTKIPTDKSYLGPNPMTIKALRL